MKLKILTMALLIGGTLHAKNTPNPALPNVLIIGDSISIGYTNPLKKILEGKANIFHNAGNAQHSRNGLARLDSWLGKTKWDVIHFNHGLHDLKYVDEKGKNSKTKQNAHVQIPLDEYQKNMEAIVARLKTLQKPKNVHFTAGGSKALAEEVAKHILKAIGQQ